MSAAAALPRRSVLAGLAAVPAAPMALIAPLGSRDAAVIAKARKVRRLCLKAEATGRRFLALDHALGEAAKGLGPKPEWNRGHVSELCIDVISAFGELTEEVSATVMRLRGALETRLEREVTAWERKRAALAERIGEPQADARATAAHYAASDGLIELARMPVDSIEGALAKASVLRPPLAFDEILCCHLELAACVLRDLGCGMARADAA